ncbi:D-alanyl-D-alanine carboxypeptidase family protein [Thermotalea metallivorans]|uniref:serine-type D-Ala-D-Ala carboxypeptidase n=1 Tax=Thermotalea metallivorans TaxID=520762 RepID=A0A140L906_9FIRM|nr:D-alanyl-D-alanine carboxypeptidase family protein [Thermotalea metallivorans]KXG77031.1 D-alanyl-D-alanine carboxypeptidase DacB [Thermotalea metallivorans]
MKKFQILSFVLVAVIINAILNPSFAVVPPPEISAPSGILIDAETGDVLYEKNAHERMYPASTTKIMTAILTLENAKLQDTVVIDKDTPFTEGNRIYAIEGEIFTVEQLLYALMVESANDAAVALAKHISGSVEEFAKLMNQRAKELGAKNTHFVNPNGLPDPEHVTTAYDLAMIAKYAMTLPKFPEIAKTVRYQIPPTNKQSETRYLKSSNRFLWGVGGRNKINYRGQWIDIKYDIVEGIKTGYTVQAQQCLVTSAQKDGHRLISVILKAQGTNIYADSRTLIDYGFENFQFVKLADAGVNVKTVAIKGGQEKVLNLITQKALYKAVPIHEKISPVDQMIKVEKDLRAPIHQGDVIGKIIYTSGEKILGEVNLIAETSVKASEGIGMIVFHEKSKTKTVIRLILSLLFLYLGWRTYVTWHRIRRRKSKALKHPDIILPSVQPAIGERNRWKSKKK